MARTRDELVALGRTATKESKQIDFKSECDPTAPGALLELIKDIVAMANSGGGAIVIGLDDVGTPTCVDVSAFLALDLAKISDLVLKMTGDEVDGLEVIADSKNGNNIAIVHVPPRSGAPLVFEKSGNYVSSSGKSKCAFPQGTVYFRHGAKSEPARTSDLVAYIRREVSTQRKEIMKNVKRVTAAPAGSQVLVAPPRSSRATAATVTGAVRVVTGNEVPAVGLVDPSTTHPYRQTELIKQLENRLGRRVAGSYQLQSVRKVHGIDTDRKPEFIYKPAWSSAQYSDAYVEWLARNFESDETFFDDAVDDLREQS